MPKEGKEKKVGNGRQKGRIITNYLKNIKILVRLFMKF